MMDEHDHAFSEEWRKRRFGVAPLWKEIVAALALAFLGGAVAATLLVFAEGFAIARGHPGLAILFAIGWLFGLAAYLLIRVRLLEAELHKEIWRRERFERASKRRADAEP